MAPVSVKETPEAAYVRALKWEFDGYRYACRGLPETIKDKLKEVFDKWGIGYYGDRQDCKGSAVNVYVAKRQFQRVEFTPDPSKMVFTNGATHENL